VARILVITNLYPSAARPGFGTFVSARVDALKRAGAAVDVVAVFGGAAHRRVAQRYVLLAVRTLAAVLAGLIRGRRFTVVEAHIAYPTGLIAWPAARILRGRLVLFAHGADVVALPRRRASHRRLARFVLERADLLVANSAYLESEIRETFPRLRTTVVVEPPGIERAMFERARRSQRSGVLFVGRLTREKGADVLLSAMQQLARLEPAQHRLRIVGAGPEWEAFEAAMASGTLELTLLGEQPPAVVAAEMGAASIVVVPSVYPESLGLVAVEGLAAGAVVVASDLGGLRETIVDGLTGVQVRPGDAGDLLAGLVRALALAGDPARLAAMAPAVREVVDRHDIEAVASRAVARYRDSWAGALRPGS
jgi:glycosyltransferase involved in cell wall biosynthesis